jgi:desulfoferrodoxin (superoxide reductase-like protein)
MIKKINRIRRGIFKLCIIMFYFFNIFLLTQNVSAHPPSKLDLYYDDEINELYVNITHSVTTDDHYIDTIEIYINDLKYNTLSYDSQPSRTSFSYNYNILAEDGDDIKVIAKCNQFGTLTRELTVGDDNSSTPSPGFLLILIIITFMILILKKRN